MRVKVVQSLSWDHFLKASLENSSLLQGPSVQHVVTVGENVR